MNVSVVTRTGAERRAIYVFTVFRRRHMLPAYLFDKAEETKCRARKLPRFPLHFQSHTSQAKAEPQFPLRPNLTKNRQPPETSPQRDRAATTCGSPSHRWDVMNHWLRYCFTLGLTLSILAPWKINTVVHVGPMNYWQTV